MSLSLRISRRSWYWVLTVLVMVGATTLPSTPASADPGVVVSLTFDNATVSQYDIGYLHGLAPHGDDATFFVNSGTIGTGPGFMTWADLQTLQAAGNEIGGKTTSFTDLTSVGVPQATAAICGDRQNLMAHGLEPGSFAYPYGAFNAETEQLVQGCGYGNARTAGDISPVGPTFAESLPPTDAFATEAFAPSGEVSLSDLEDLVNGAEGNGGGWIQIVLQDVCSATLDQANYGTCKGSGGSIELADLNAFLDWVNDAGNPQEAPSGTSIRSVRDAVSLTDSTSPTTALSCDEDACTDDPYTNWATIGLSATDTGSGVASIRYTTDGSTPDGASPLYTGPFIQSTSATIQYRSWDYAGNVSPVGSRSVQVVPGPPDTAAPISSILCDGVACSTTPYSRAVSVSLSAKDGKGSGVDKIRYTTDGSTPDDTSPVYTTPFELDQSTTVRFFATDVAGNAETPQAASFVITPSPVTVSLTWDDGEFNLYDVAWLHALKPHNVLSTFYVNSGNVGTGRIAAGIPAFMRWSDLQEMYAAGNEIGGHTVDHVDLVSADAATRLHQVCDDRQALLAHNLHPTSFAYPFGSLNQSVEDVVQHCGYSNARSGGGEQAGGPWADTIPPADPYATLGYAPPDDGELTLSDLESAVVAASAHGGGWVNILGHVVCSQQYLPQDYAACSSYFGWMQLGTLNAFLDWMQDAGQPGGAPAGATLASVRQAIGPALSQDVTPPTTTISCNGVPCLGTAYQAGVSLALDATDAGSGIAQIVYTTDGSDPTVSAHTQIYTGPIVLQHTAKIRFFAIDDAMNAEAAHTTTVTVAPDGVAPVTSITCNGDPCTKAWSRGDVEVALAATDAGSGVAATRYTTDGSTPTLHSPVYTGPLLISKTTTFSFSSWDNAGNKEAVKRRSIKIDAATPTVSITAPLDGASIVRAKTLTVTATAADLGTNGANPSGVAKVALFVDGGSSPVATDATAPYSFAWKAGAMTFGPHTLMAVATDAAGNTMDSTVVTVTLVPAAPQNRSVVPKRRPS